MGLITLTLKAKTGRIIEPSQLSIFFISAKCEKRKKQ